MSTYNGYFRDISGTQWTLSVETPSGSSSYSLQLASDPIIVEMDDSEDMLTPVRLTTGYIRVVGYNSSLYPTMGSQYEVKLNRSSNTFYDWRGYIQPQAYDIPIKRVSSDVYEIPVECPLSALGHIDLPISSLGSMPSFGQILYYIMSQQDRPWTLVYFPGVTEAQYVLSTRINRQMLVTTDIDGNEQSKYSCLEFIEEFCKFFGYCCRYDGNGGMVFMRMFKQQSNYSIISKNYLTYGWIPSSYFSGGYYKELSDSGSPYASTNQKIQFVRGFRKVSVNADVAKASTVLFEMPTNWLLDYLQDGTTISSSTIRNNYYYYEKITSRSFEYSFTHDGWQWTFGTHSMKDDFTLSTGARLILLSYSSEKTPTMQWKPVIEVGKYTEGAAAAFKLTSQRPFSFSSGLLVISATTYTKRGHLKYTGNGKLYVKVGIGGYYYGRLSVNGSWNSGYGVYEINVGSSYDKNRTDNEGSTGEICSNYIFTDPRLNYNGGAGLKVNNNGGSLPVNMGIVELEIYGVELMKEAYYDNTSELCIEDLKVEFLPIGMSNIAHDEVDEAYTYKNGSKFRDEKSISVAFASDKYKIPGENSIFDQSGSLASTLPFMYSGTLENLHPEYFVAKYASIYGQRTHQLLDIELDASVTGWVHPLTMFSGFEPSGKTWWVVSVDKDFANNTQRIRAIEL